MESGDSRGTRLIALIQLTNLTSTGEHGHRSSRSLSVCLETVVKTTMEGGKSEISIRSAPWNPIMLMILSRQFIITLKELSVFVHCVLMCILPFYVQCTWNDECQEVVMVANLQTGYEPRWWSWSWLQWSCLTMAAPDETRPEYPITECIWYVLRRRGAGRHSSASLTLTAHSFEKFTFSPK